MEKLTKKYIEVILPIKFRETVTYSIPENLTEKIKIGSRVSVLLANKRYKAIVDRFNDSPEYDIRRIKEIEGIDDFPPASSQEIQFWKAISEYYMCSTGEVLKAAYPYSIEPLKRVKKEDSTKINEELKPSEKQIHNMKKLSESEQYAFDEIQDLHGKKKTVLLSGITCSGKTEVLVDTAAAYISRGENVLVLTPDISACKALEKRFIKIFPEQRLIVYHSKLTEAKKRTIIETVRSTQDEENNQGYLILGLRSSLFLPIKKLGLIIITNEHDSSYKQSDPAPRYNGRDAALMLAKITGANAILSSPTPSYESLQNIQTGKYSEVHLTELYSDCYEFETRIIDTRKEFRKNSMRGSFAISTIKAIKDAINDDQQIAVYNAKNSFITDENLITEIAETFHDSGIGIFSEISSLESLKNKPSLIILLQAENLFHSQDFRGDEKAIQLLERIEGVLRKGKTGGLLIIQTSIPSHPVFKQLSSPSLTNTTLLDERKEYDLPPFTRMIQISIRDIFENRLEINAERLKKIIINAGATNLTGPSPAPYEKDDKHHTLIFRIKLKKDKSSEIIKKSLYNSINSDTIIKGDITLDVDPLY